MTTSRRRLLCLLALPVLAILALGWPTWQAWSHYAGLRPVFATIVPPGADGEYDGARWRLLETVVQSAPSDNLGRRIELPDGAVSLLARFAVVPGPATDLEALRLCEGRLRDPAGLIWTANRLSAFRPASKLPDNCGWSLGDPQNWMDMTERKATPGEPWTFELSFVIPAEAAGRVEPELLLREQYPDYLRFRR